MWNMLLMRRKITVLNVKMGRDLRCLKSIGIRKEK